MRGGPCLHTAPRRPPERTGRAVDGAGAVDSRPCGRDGGVNGEPSGGCPPPRGPPRLRGAAERARPARARLPTPPTAAATPQILIMFQNQTPDLGTSKPHHTARIAAGPAFRVPPAMLRRLRVLVLEVQRSGETAGLWVLWMGAPRLADRNRACLGGAAIQAAVGSRAHHAAHADARASEARLSTAASEPTGAGGSPRCRRWRADSEWFQPATGRRPSAFRAPSRVSPGQPRFVPRL